MFPIGIQIIENIHAPLPAMLRYPKKGPYFQKRLRRMRNDPANWSKPEFFQVGNQIIAHPSLIPLLRHSLGDTISF